MKLKWIRIRGLIFYIIYCLIILTISYFINKFFQMLIFILGFDLIQNCFSKRFHSDTIIDNPIKATKYCKLITIVIQILFLIYCNETNLSIYGSLFIIFVICIINFLLQYFFERNKVNKSILSDKETLLTLCKEVNLSEEATKRLVMKYIEHKTYEEIAMIEYVNVETIKKSINRSRKKLNIT